MTTRMIDITPDVSLLRKAGEVNYKIPQAVAELVDNAVDARINGKKLIVEIKIGYGKKRYIEIADTAVGMAPGGAEAAMVMARSDKRDGTIGEFGMGLKTAASNLGAHFELVTATANSAVGTRIVYDEAAFLARGKWELQVEEIDKPFEHGTVITITEPKTNLYPGVKDTLLRNFGKTFKHFVGSGEVEIIVNGDLVEPYMPETIKDYDTELKFEVKDKLVRGWASLAKQGSGKGAYGFDLVRHNRVVREHAKVGFRPAAALTRLIGELHLDSFPVTNNKTDFRVDTEEWQELERKLAEEILDLVRAARKISNPGKLAPKDEAEVEEHIEEVKESLRSQELQEDLDRRALDSDLADEFSEGPIPFEISAEEDEIGDTPGSGGGAPEDTDTNGGGRRKGDPSAIEQHRLNRVKTQLRNLSIEHEIMRLGKETPYKIWDVDGVGNRKRLVVTTNVDHPFYGVVEAGGFMLWVKHNIVEAVAEYFTSETGRTENMLLVKSDILKHIGKMKIELVEDADEDVTSA
jgi:hypothetical protein